MKKYLLDLEVKAVEHINEKYVLIRLTDSKPLPEMIPGQFVELRIDSSATTFLRRPISIHFVDRQNNELWLLVAVVGDGTKALAKLKAGAKVNTLLPLGNGFSINNKKQVVLVGGGVGVAPLLYAGKMAKEEGTEVTFILGARSAKDLLELNEFAKYGNLSLTTEDGSAPEGYEGVTEKGFVTNHSIWATINPSADNIISVCGPTPMMKAVANLSKEKGLNCEVSLENMMACGLGACLCCVQDTKEGNLCVCKEGPVFDINKLNW